MSGAVYEQIGVVTVIVLAGIAAIAVALALLVAVIRYWPRLHTGKPENQIRLTVTGERGRIISREGGAAIDGTETYLIRSIRLKWWLGLSCRRRVKWFLGFMRYEEESRP